MVRGVAAPPRGSGGCAACARAHLEQAQQLREAGEAEESERFEQLRGHSVAVHVCAVENPFPGHGGDEIDGEPGAEVQTGDASGVQDHYTALSVDVSRPEVQEDVDHEECGDGVAQRLHPRGVGQGEKGNAEGDHQRNVAEEGEEGDVPPHSEGPVRVHQRGPVHPRQPAAGARAPGSAILLRLRRLLGLAAEYSVGHAADGV